MLLGNRRWGEAIQNLVMTETCGEMPWQTIMGDRILWDSLEFKVPLDRVLRQSRAQRSERMRAGRQLAEPDRDHQEEPPRGPRSRPWSAEPSIRVLFWAVPG